MIDVSFKFDSLRTARARAVLKMNRGTVERVRKGEIPKGDPLEAARIAGIQAAKRTSDLIPYCHPIFLDHAEVRFEFGADCIFIETLVRAIHRTGVEMEALCAASLAALTIYDMVKFMDPGAMIADVRLVEKEGGKSDFMERDRAAFRAAVLVISDSTSRGERIDSSGALIRDRLLAEGASEVEYEVVPDEEDAIREMLKSFTDRLDLDLVLTTGGTGFGPRDRTPEVFAELLDRLIPGVPETIRAYGQRRTPYAMLSRGVAGLRGKTLLISLPGSQKAVEESLDALFPGVLHAFSMIRGQGHGDHGPNAAHP